MMNKKKEMTFRKFLGKIRYRKIEEQSLLKRCFGCGKFRLLKYEVFIDGENCYCCDSDCAKRNFYPYYRSILGLWRDGLKPKKHKRTSGYHKPTYQKGRFTEPETELPTYHVSSECPLPLY